MATAKKPAEPVVPDTPAAPEVQVTMAGESTATEPAPVHKTYADAVAYALEQGAKKTLTPVVVEAPPVTAPPEE